MSKSMPKWCPVKEDFDSKQIKIHGGIRWDLNRGSDTGGGNAGQTFNVPKGRAVVEWSAEETSCIRCKGKHYRYLSFEEENGIKIPNGIHVGVRFKKGHPAGSKGASYTGTITMVSVPKKAWRKVWFKKQFGE